MCIVGNYGYFVEYYIVVYWNGSELFLGICLVVRMSNIVGEIGYVECYLVILECLCIGVGVDVIGWVRGSIFCS